MFKCLIILGSSIDQTVPWHPSLALVGRESKEDSSIRWGYLKQHCLEYLSAHEFWHGWNTWRKNLGWEQKTTNRIANNHRQQLLLTCPKCNRERSTSSDTAYNRRSSWTNHGWILLPSSKQFSHRQTCKQNRSSFLPSLNTTWSLKHVPIL